MKRSEFEALGDRQKSFENVEACQVLVPGLPIMVRLDGRAFSTFTRGLARPYDERMSRCMIETTKYLVQHTHADIGYTQSDEISLAFSLSLDLDKQMMFNGRVQKICSVFASMASVKFNQMVQQLMPEKASLLPVFDGRCWNVNDLDTACECFLWREADATRNSLTMAASSLYSHGELHKVGSKEKHDLLHAKGVNWNNYPAFFKRGTYVRRETILKDLTSEELEKIPENHRPDGPIYRSVINELDMPPLSKVVNVKDVLFGKDQPMVLDC